MTYRITVKPIKGRDYLTYKHVESYKIEEGLLIFTDSMTSKIKRYAVPNTEIEEESEVKNENPLPTKVGSFQKTKEKW